MIRSLLDYLFSRSKWNKLLLLSQERMLSLSYLGGSLLGIGAKDCSTGAVGVGQPIVDFSPEGQDACVAQATIQSWHFDAIVPLDYKIFKHRAVPYAQDTYSDTGQLQTRFDYQFADIPGASLCSNGATHVSVFDAHDRCLADYSYIKYRREGNRVAFKKRHLAIDKYYAGVTLNLFGSVENAAGNYGHWIVDGVGLLYLALQHVALDEIDYFLVPTIKYDFQRDTLLAVGIPEHKILEIPVLSCWRFERLLCATAPRGVSSSNTPGWLIDGYRASVLPSQPSTAGKRLYISRRDAGSRKFINEEDIIAMLMRHGFESVEMSRHDFNQKIALFAQADVIVGLTGAGLTNLMFCQHDAQVIELFPASYVTYFYASMAGHLGLDYRALIFENDSVISDVNKYYGNLSLDVALLESYVVALDAPAESR